MVDLVTLDEIRRAAKHIHGIAIRTPLICSPAWPGLWLKPENLQPIGAFKIRGAVNALACLPEPARAAGVITHSSGNHGQALAFAAARLGVPCVVVMPEQSPKVKIDAVRALGAEVVIVPAAQRDARCTELAETRNLTIVPPFDHRDVIAGQATLGLEIVEELPDVACVLVPVGGGGLASGVASAIKALAPHAVVVGVEPELAADAAESLREHRVIRWPVEQTYRTVADGLRTNLSELTLAHLQERLDGIVTVSEAEIRSAVGELARHARIVAEPSGAVAPAAWLYHRAELAYRFGITDPSGAQVSSGERSSGEVLGGEAESSGEGSSGEGSSGEALGGEASSSEVLGGEASSSEGESGAATTSAPRRGPIVAVVSGGNLDPVDLARLLSSDHG